MDKLTKPAKVVKKITALVPSNWKDPDLHDKQVQDLMGKIGVVVDYSDSHGLCYGMVFPNTEGNAGRRESLPVYWFDPGEISFEFDHTGFIVRYNDGTSLEEQNNYFDKALNRDCATNWHRVDKSRIRSLELWWRGEFKCRINPPDMSPEKNGVEWFFHHTGNMGLNDASIVVTLSRTIGIKGNKFEKTYTVNESTGELKTSISY